MYDKNITPLSYKDAGVDIDAGNTLVERIKHISKNYYPPRARKVLNLISRIKSEKEIKVTLGGCLINKRQNNLIISKEELKKSIKL